MSHHRETAYSFSKVKIKTNNSIAVYIYTPTMITFVAYACAVVLNQWLTIIICSLYNIIILVQLKLYSIILCYRL